MHPLEDTLGDDLAVGDIHHSLDEGGLVDKVEKRLSLTTGLRREFGGGDAGEFGFEVRYDLRFGWFDEDDSFEGAFLAGVEGLVSVLSLLWGCLLYTSPSPRD